MKNALTLIGSILAGIALMFLVSNLTAPKSEKPLVNPASSSPLSQTKFSIENAPTSSLKVQVSTMSGKILYESRVATEPAEVKTLTQVQQGETLVTDQTGTLKAQIPGQLNINLSPKTELEFSQTLPSNIVLTQNKGQVEYFRSGSDPVSVRSNDLLIQMDGTSLVIIVNDAESRITVEATKGSAKVGYNDPNQISTVKSLSEGDTLIFNEDTKTARVI